jgi:hypothetical protein
LSQESKGELARFSPTQCALYRPMRGDQPNLITVIDSVEMASQRVESLRQHRGVKIAGL